MPNGVAWRQGSLYVAEAVRVNRWDNIDTTYRSLGSPSAIILDNIPVKNNFWHAWKFIRFSPDDELLYLPVGAPCNYCLRLNTPGNPVTDLQLPLDSITTLKPDGSEWKVYAKGNPIFVCCKGCIKKVQQNPDLYIAKTAGLNRSAARSRR